MGSLNKSHNESDGGILLFQGELILLYCDSVQCEVGGKESFKARVYLTTHRLVSIMTPYRQNASVKSLCAPFCAITKCGVEQPIFGANYIEATVRDEADPSKSFSFKLKFSKGGAIELAMAMNRAVAAVGRNFNPSMPPPPAYTPSPSAQYYQAPPTVYAPGYNTGVPMPTQQFPDAPPIGFIYASSAPPPYPGIGGNSGPAQNPNQSQQQQPSSGYPNTTAAGGYPGSGAGGYHSQYPYPAAPQASSYPGQQPQGPGAYPGHQQQASNYPGQQPQGPGAYPGHQQQPSGYPGQQQGGYPQPTGGYPGQPGGQQQQPGAYPQQPATSGSQQPPSAGYPDLSQGAGIASANQGSWPTAPSFNPNWQDQNKSS